MSNPSDNPLISVVIPTYKRPDYLQAAVRCIQNQTFTDWELIVSDDEKPASKTWALLQELAISDARIRPIQNLEGQGQSDNTNHGMNHARGQWIKLLHDDDSLVPHCLEQLASVAKQADPQVVLITTGSCDRGGEDTQQVDHPLPSQVSRYRGNEALYGMYVQHDVGGSVPSAMMFRSRVIHQGITFEQISQLPTAVDTWFKARLLTQGDLIHIDRPMMIKCEEDALSITNTLDRRGLDQEYQVIRKMMQPLVDPSLNPPAVSVVQGQVRLIRAMHRLTTRHPLEAVAMALTVWNPEAWWLATRWAVRRVKPHWCQKVRPVV